jgi:hypothetical protein
MLILFYCINVNPLGYIVLFFYWLFLIKLIVLVVKI